ncbi:MAG: hypothetical protein KC503_00775 [Myxococcales bacterium]|nr:hypothetical protein [Myxococcales bacterium]
MLVRLLAAVGLLATLTATPARAADGPDPLAAAKKLYLEGYFERAASAFSALAARADLASKTRARAKLYVGLCLHGREKPREAAAAFRQALALDATLRLSAQRFKPEVVALFEKVRRALRGRLRLRLRLAAGAPAGSTVLVDGDPVADASKALALGIGEHVVELRDGQGRTLEQRVVVVEPDRTRELVLRGRAVTTARRADLVVRPTPATPPRARWRRPLAWISAGSALALAGVGIGLGAAVASDHDAWSQRDPTTPEAQSLRAAGQKKMIAANVLIGAAVVAAITAVALFVRRVERGR